MTTDEEYDKRLEEEEIKPLQVTIKKDKETPYDGEDSYQYEDLNPTDEELEDDFPGT